MAQSIFKKYKSMIDGAEGDPVTDSQISGKMTPPRSTSPRKATSPRRTAPPSATVSPVKQLTYADVDMSSRSPGQRQTQRRDSLSQIMSRGDGTGRQGPISAVDVKANMYSEAYIERLQGQHRERVESLLDRIKEARDAQKAAEDALGKQTRDEDAEYDRREANIEAALNEAKIESDDALQALRDEMDALRQHHETATAELKQAHQQQIEALHDKSEASMRALREQAILEAQAAMTRETRAVQNAKNDAMIIEKELRDAMEALVMENQRQLEAVRALAVQQGEKAAEARESLCASQTRHDAEVAQLKDRIMGTESDLRRLQSLREREIHQLRNDSALNVQKMRQHYETRISTTEQANSTLTSRVKSLEGQLAAQKANHQGQLSAAARDVSLLNGYFNQAQKQIDDRRTELDAMERKFERSIKERDVLVKEREMLRCEVQRLRDTNDTLQNATDRENRSMYGL